MSYLLPTLQPANPPLSAVAVPTDQSHPQPGPSPVPSKTEKPGPATEPLSVTTHTTPRNTQTATQALRNRGFALPTARRSGGSRSKTNPTAGAARAMRSRQGPTRPQLHQAPQPGRADNKQKNKKPCALTNQQARALSRPASRPRRPSTPQRTLHAQLQAAKPCASTTACSKPSPNTAT